MVKIKMVTENLQVVELCHFIQEYLNFIPFLYLLILNYLKSFKKILILIILLSLIE
jgi:hypothetical protein